MAEAQNGVAPEHAGTGITHNRSNLLAPDALIAMDGAPGADGFVRPKPAAIQPNGGIIQELPALRAKGGADMVMGLTVTADHGGHGLVFTGETLAEGAPGACFALFRHWPQVKGAGRFHIIRSAQASHRRRRASLTQVKVPREYGRVQRRCLLVSPTRIT